MNGNINVFLVGNLTNTISKLIGTRGANEDFTVDSAAKTKIGIYLYSGDIMGYNGYIFNGLG